MLLAGSVDARLLLYALLENGIAAPVSLDVAIGQVFRGEFNGKEIWPRVTNAIDASVFARVRDIKADLSDTGTYLTFTTGALEYLISPHARCPKYADLSGINNRAVARR